MNFPTQFDFIILKLYTFIENKKYISPEKYRELTIIDLSMCYQYAKYHTHLLMS